MLELNGWNKFQVRSGQLLVNSVETGLLAEGVFSKIGPNLACSCEGEDGLQHEKQVSRKIKVKTLSLGQGPQQRVIYGYQVKYLVAEELLEVEANEDLFHETADFMSLKRFLSTADSLRAISQIIDSGHTDEAILAGVRLMTGLQC